MRARAYAASIQRKPRDRHAWGMKNYVIGLHVVAGCMHEVHTWGMGNYVTLAGLHLPSLEGLPQ